MGKHRVWVGRVPSTLCANEGTVRELFETFGKLHSVLIHHNLMDTSANGFMFLEFASKRAAQRAVDAVQSGELELPSDVRRGEMRAAHALRHGDRAPADGEDGAEDLRDLLFGRRTPRAGFQRGSHSSAVGDEDDEDAMLQSLSQRSFGSQRKRHKRRKVRE